MRRFALIVREFCLYSTEYANSDLITSECRLIVIILNLSNTCWSFAYISDYFFDKISSQRFPCSYNLCLTEMYMHILLNLWIKVFNSFCYASRTI